MSAQYSSEEKSYYDRLFNVIDKDQLGVLTGEACYAFLLTSKLPQATLGTIWSMVDSANNGYLTKDGWYRACRLIGWAQKGDNVSEEFATKQGPYPVFEGQTPPQSSPMPAQVTNTQLPPLNPSDKAQFTRLFVGAGPENGMLSATKAQGIFVKSSLPTEILAKAWNLADTQQRGALDLPDFIIGMYYLQHLMTGTIKDLPIALPPGLYEQASGGRSKPVPPPNPMVAQLTGNTPMRLSQQLTGQGAMQPQRTGQSIAAQSPTRQYTAPPPPASTFQSPFGGSSAQSNGPAWDVTPDSKAASDRFFEGLDTGRKGFIEGDIAVPFLMQSGLPESDLAQVWDLADIRKEGKLTKDEFAVAMFLINNKLAGKELPSSLSQSMIPPSLRTHSAVAPPQNDATKDLFDVFGDSPPAMAPAAVPQQSYFASPPSRAASVNVPPPTSSIRSPVGPPSRLTSPPPVPTRSATGMDAFGSTPFGSQPDLMGDESAPTPKPAADYSSEIGNAQNSLTSTEKAVSDLEREKKGLEADSSASAAQLKELELRLSSVRAQHDTETRVVTDLRTRVSEQKENITKLKQTLIQNESELSALRAEKDETEQALLRDKEEVRATSKRMKEVADETTSLKTLLEKLKKEARQQKGMVAISKKQVSTAELNKDGVQREIDQVAASNNERDDEEVLNSPAQVTSPSMSPFARPVSSASLHQAAAIPLPMTPQQALSPVATGANQRSNNPFERLGFAVKPADRAVSPPQGAFANASAQAADHEGISTLQAATMGVGGIAAVGALAAGSVVGAAALGAGAAVATVAERATHDGEDLKSPQQPISQPEEESSDDEARTPPANQNRADPFGMDEQETTPGVTPAANVTSDPFGLPVAADREQTEQAGFSSGFEDGFGDDFSKSNPAVVSDLETSDLHPSQDRFALPDNLAPASQTAEDFEEALNERSGSMSAIPAAMRPDLESQGRTFSTEVFAPDSIAQTPETELPPSTPMSMESTAVPVDVKALQPPHAEQENVRGSHEDSSDEEDEPEDLDRARSPYEGRESGGPSTSTSMLSGQRNELERDQYDEPRTMEPAQYTQAPETQEMFTEKTSYGDVPRTQSPPSEQLQALGLGAPVAMGSTPQAVPAAFGADDAFDPFAPQAISSTSSAMGAQRRREPPPPPTTQRSISNSNPFGAMPAGNSAFGAPSTSGPVAVVAQSSSSAFDDDFDFDDLQPAQIAAGGLAPPVAQQSTSKTTTDFDDEFDDFSPDFEMINKPISQNNMAIPLNDNFANSNGQGAPQIPAFENQTGFGTVNPSTSSGFSFEDAFMDRTDATPNHDIAPATGMDHFAAPAAPLTKAPAQSERPSLPQRQTAGMTKAQPDDLADVKKLCNMGFDRNLVIDALEGADYNFDKALNFLLPGA